MEFEKVRQIIGDVLNLHMSEIGMESKFSDDLGADSLDIFQIIIGLEEEFGIAIPNDAAEGVHTVGDAVLKIQNATS